MYSRIVDWESTAVVPGAASQIPRKRGNPGAGTETLCITSSLLCKFTCSSMREALSKSGSSLIINQLTHAGLPRSLSVYPLALKDSYHELKFNVSWQHSLECVAGVCSCAHSPRLPAPAVSAHTVPIQGDIFVNVSWVTPPPHIGKQMVSDAHPSPWFANTVSRFVDADGLVSVGDSPRWLLLPVTERSVERGDKRSDKIKPRHIVLDVRLLARVTLIDSRGCMGPAGNATAYALIAVSARVVKRVLNAFRPTPVSAPLEPLRRRPAWFPLQPRLFKQSYEIPKRTVLCIYIISNNEYIINFESNDKYRWSLLEDYGRHKAD
ncbi:Uncharacterized protein OBRU01_10775 [Operophtera brumata]|uniref:Uncharacterized protein n=1 Tax=Operophtera brumata TaxID=104452 RepID=A0A0L7LCX6_OPEBR|nr:Uncharacterized protein OBRU01_10775 [Operophtera brumata]